MRNAVYMVLSVVMTVGAGPATAQSTQEMQALGQVVAAADIADACKGIELIASNETNEYVLAAAGLLKQQGYRKQRMLKYLFYGKTPWLKGLSTLALQERGVDKQNTNELCRFGRQVAGKNDAIGRFMLPPK